MSEGAKEKSNECACNTCACGGAHYCEKEVTEILTVMRNITLTTQGDQVAVDEVMRKYDGFYYRRRVRQSGHASQARPEE